MKNPFSRRVPQISIKPPPEPPHMHDLQVIDVFWPQRVPMQPQFTDVLYGCRDCAHVETVTIDGKWSMEQVTRLHRDDSNGKLYDPQDGA